MVDADENAMEAILTEAVAPDTILAEDSSDSGALNIGARVRNQVRPRRPSQGLWERKTSPDQERPMLKPMPSITWSKDVQVPSSMNVSEGQPAEEAWRKNATKRSSISSQLKQQRTSIVARGDEAPANDFVPTPYDAFSSYEPTNVGSNGNSFEELLHRLREEHIRQVNLLRLALESREKEEMLPVLPALQAPTPIARSASWNPPSPTPSPGQSPKGKSPTGPARARPVWAPGADSDSTAEPPPTTQPSNEHMGSVASSKKSSLGSDVSTVVLGQEGDEIEEVDLGDRASEILVDDLKMTSPKPPLPAFAPSAEEVCPQAPSTLDAFDSAPVPPAEERSSFLSQDEDVANGTRMEEVVSLKIPRFDDLVTAVQLNSEQPSEDIPGICETPPMDNSDEDKNDEPQHDCQGSEGPDGDTVAELRSVGQSRTSGSHRKPMRSSTMPGRASTVPDLKAAMDVSADSLDSVTPKFQRSDSVLSMSSSSPRKRALPRIAGLKHSGSSLSKPDRPTRFMERKNSNLGEPKGASFGRESRLVMFDESAGLSGTMENSEAENAAPEVIQEKQQSQGNMQVRSAWLESQEPTKGAAGRLTRTRTPSQRINAVCSQISLNGEEAASRDSTTGFVNAMNRFVSHPNSTLNFYCDVLSILCIGHDVVVVPLEAFQVDDTFGTEVLHAITTIFWTIDFFRNFLKGFYNQGDVVMSFVRISKKYAFSWALPDFTIVIADWVHWVVRLTSEDGNSNFSRLLRVLRNMRSIRLLRGVKTAHILKMIEDRIQSEALGVCWTTIKLLILILFANHLITCMWYWLGGRAGPDEPSWHKLYLDTHPSGGSFQYKYLTSFHWSMTQFTPASINVQPENARERLYAICVLICAFVTMSTFISGLTNAVMHLRQLSSAKHKQFWLLRRYLMESGVPTKLAVRINNYCEHAWTLRDKRLQEKNIELLMLISMSLRAELKETIFSPKLKEHPFFTLLQLTAPMSIRMICSAAVTQSELARGDDIFMYGEEAKHMFFVQRSKLSYRLVDDLQGAIVDSNSWVCETCLWTEWVYRGTLTTVSDSTTVAVESDSFGKVVHSNPEALQEAMHYAKGFLSGLNRAPQWKLSDLYTSSLIEGLWFRLLKDYAVRKRSTIHDSTKGDSIMSRRKVRAGGGISMRQVQANQLWTGLREKTARWRRR